MIILFTRVAKNDACYFPLAVNWHELRDCPCMLYGLHELMVLVIDHTIAKCQREILRSNAEHVSNSSEIGESLYRLFPSHYHGNNFKTDQ